MNDSNSVLRHGYVLAKLKKAKIKTPKITIGYLSIFIIGCGGKMFAS